MSKPERIVLSRKGCDSTSGGCDSPILPNRRLISLPVPAAGISYWDIEVAPGLSCGQMMQELGISTLKNAWLGEAKHAALPLEQAEAHFDPDLELASRPRGRGWRPLFGQVGAPQGELKNRQVGKGDLFLFFGRFRWTECPEQRGDRRKWVGLPMHLIWGWLEVDRAIDVNTEPTPAWAGDFPHVKHRAIWAKVANVVYVATKRLSLEPSLPGGGVFSGYRDELRLSGTAGVLPDWDLPAVFDGARFSHLRQVGSVQCERTRWDASGQWQEAIGEATEGILDWARLLFRNEAAARSSTKGSSGVIFAIVLIVIAVLILIVATRTAVFRGLSIGAACFDPPGGLLSDESGLLPAFLSFALAAYLMRVPARCRYQFVREEFVGSLIWSRRSPRRG